MKRTLIALVALMLTVAAFAAPGRRPQAGPGGPQRGPGGGFLSPQLIAEFLDLSEAQKTQVQTLRESLRNTIEPLREQMRTNRQAIEAAVDAGNAQQAGQLLIAGKAIRDQIKTAHDNFETQFEALLTAEQKAKWAVVKELMELRRNQREPDDE
ncbi:MAG TPA: Spy/CpxP family protein refolding chaperone [Thermoanaerobaculia bacterium]|nr:Spy/CpxP family protein refolding chaperone [Thermoanaerobaculia bacterium]